LEAR